MQIRLLRVCLVAVHVQHAYRHLHVLLRRQTYDSLILVQLQAYTKLAYV